MSELTAERVRELLHYDPETGVFLWRVRYQRVKIGDVAGCLHPDGYIRITISRRRFYSHRLAWLHVYGEWPTAEVDHINGSRSDNRLANLRAASHSENQHNRRKKQANNRSGFLGVWPYRGKFRASIKFDGKPLHLGTFPTPEEAHAAYVAAKRRLHPFGNL